jgi:hypothetical protein
MTGDKMGSMVKSGEVRRLGWLNRLTVITQQLQQYEQEGVLKDEIIRKSTGYNRPPTGT